jgi:hypothetical protein
MTILQGIQIAAQGIDSVAVVILVGGLFRGYMAALSSLALCTDFSFPDRIVTARPELAPVSLDTILSNETEKE